MRLLRPAFIGTLLLALAGCTSVPPYEQQLLARPSMQFSDSPVSRYDSNLLTTIEPGSASNGGAAATGCSSCR